MLHRADPRVKLLCAGLLSLVMAVCQHLTTAFVGLVAALFLVAAAQLSWKGILSRLLVVNGFNIMFWLLLPLTYGGPERIALAANLTLSKNGFLLAALITVKSNTVILLFIALLSTSSAAYLGRGLNELGLSPQLCQLLLLSYRYIAVIHQETQRLQRAATLRCFQPQNTLHTYRTYSHLVGMVIVRSWNRADRIQQAMSLRGFSGTFHTLDDLHIAPGDMGLLVVLSLLASGLLLFELC